MGIMLVTGGAGFIGSNFVRHVLSEGRDRVVVLDKLTYAGNLENLAGLTEKDGFAFIRGDIADPACLEGIFGKHRPDAVVNFAAETHVDRSIDSPKPFVDTNIVGAFELLEACRMHARRLGAEEAAAFRFLHVSTDEVYGSLGAEGLFSERTAYAPNSPYAASKASADHLVRAYYKTYDLPVLITNCSNNYGPYQFPEKLIPLMILNAVEGTSLPIYGDGGNVRDWIYVEDHCEGILAVLRGGRPGESYNIGGDGEKTNLEVVDTICRILDELLPASENRNLTSRNFKSYADLKTFVPDRKGHDWRYAIDAGKIRGELDWRPEHDFEAGMKATVRWYLDHQDWCRTVQEQGRYERQRLGLSEEEGKQQ
jgi:dTDP-glucose 4,6-dehydratase